MPAARLSSVPWYIRDWFLSKARLKLSPAVRIGYFEILLLMYESEDGYVDNDVAYFMGVTGLDSTGIDAALKLINPENRERFTHPKVQQVLEAIRRESERQSDRAKRGWRKRKGSTGNQRQSRKSAAHISGNASLKPEALAEGFQPSGSRNGGSASPEPAAVRSQEPTPPPTPPRESLPAEPAPMPDQVREQLARLGVHVPRPRLRPPDDPEGGDPE